MLQLTVFVALFSTPLALAPWYDALRCHAHTRLSIQAFCSVENKTCKPVFENAADLFKELGVEAFVRHSKTGDEGTWWPTATGPKESWHPFVQETGRNLPQEFINKAHANQQKIILYHYPKTSTFYAEQEKSWLNRDINGNPVSYPRGLGLCVNSPWRQKYIQQLLELIEFGVDGFYYDGYPQPYQGCWCDFCRVKFKEQTGRDLPKTMNASDPDYKLLLEFTTTSVLQHYEEITMTVNSQRPDVVNLVSIYKVPAVDNSGRVYESTKLLNSTDGTAAKTEFEIPVSANVFFHHTKPLSHDGFDADVFLSMGWSISRDAGDGRPPHTWLPHLQNSSQAAAGAFALMAYGMVANPDHVEDKIPDHQLFDLTYKNAAKLNPYLNATRPIRWAGLLFSESARNVYLPQNETAAWTNVLFSTVSAWEALIRMRAPAGIITDWQLSGNSSTSRCQCGSHEHNHEFSESVAPHAGKDLFSQGYRIIIIPIANISTAQNDSLIEFEQAGGKVIFLNPRQSWYEPEERQNLEAGLQEKVLAMAGPLPIQIQSVGRFVHAIPLQSSGRPSSFVVMVTNDCRWVYFNTGIPSPVVNATLQIRNMGSDPGKVQSVTDILTNGKLKIQWDGKGTWTIPLPTFSQYLSLQIQCNGPCWGQL